MALSESLLASVDVGTFSCFEVVMVCSILCVYTKSTYSTGEWKKSAKLYMIILYTYIYIHTIPFINFLVLHCDPVALLRLYLSIHPNYFNHLSDHIQDLLPPAPASLALAHDSPQNDYWHPLISAPCSTSSCFRKSRSSPPEAPVKCTKITN